MGMGLTMTLGMVPSDLLVIFTLCRPGRISYVPPPTSRPSTLTMSVLQYLRSGPSLALTRATEFEGRLAPLYITVVQAMQQTVSNGHATFE